MLQKERVEKALIITIVIAVINALKWLARCIFSCSTLFYHGFCNNNVASRSLLECSDMMLINVLLHAFFALALWIAILTYLLTDSSFSGSSLSAIVLILSFDVHMWACVPVSLSHRVWKPAAISVAVHNELLVSPKRRASNISPAHLLPLSYFSFMPNGKSSVCCHLVAFVMT